MNGRTGNGFYLNLVGVFTVSLDNFAYGKKDGPFRDELRKKITVWSARWDYGKNSAEYDLLKRQKKSFSAISFPIPAIEAVLVNPFTRCLSRDYIGKSVYLMLQQGLYR